MTKNSRNRRNKKRSSSGRPTGNTVLHNDLKDLLEYQKAQMIKFIPEEKDVPRLRFTQNQIYNIEGSYATSVSSSNSAAVIGGLAFTLQSLGNYASYTAVFDLYRIVQVNVKYIVPTGPVSPVLTVLDYDDAGAPGSQGSFFNYATLKVTPPGTIDERTLTPHFAAAAYSGTFTSYANLSNRQWIDAASPAVQYYGLKYYFPISAVGTPALQFIVTLMVQFKSQRSS